MTTPNTKQKMAVSTASALLPGMKAKLLCRIKPKMTATQNAEDKKK
jgi:hypothetical protein